MALNQTDLKNVIRPTLSPKEDPIDTIYEFDPEHVNLPTFDGENRTVGFGTTGLDLDDETSIRGLDVNEVKTYLDKLNFTPYINEYYDCEDRAFWGMVHVRQSFRGSAVGVISGKMSGKDHAMIILWHKVGNYWIPEYYDPEKGGLIKENELRPNKTPFDELKSIISVPTGPAKTPPCDLIDPLDGLLIYDEKRMIYRSSTIFNYLKYGLYNKKKTYACGEDHEVRIKKDKKRYKRDYDLPLWAFAHCRRDFPGAPIGVAIGTCVDGESDSVLILWHHENDQPDDTKNLVYRYWDLVEDETVQFKPTMIFV